MIPQDLYMAIKKSWDRETCWPPMQHEWSEQNPSRGQCLITALLIHNDRGGEVVMADVFVPGKEEPELHFYNRLGEWDYDMTRDQFPEGTRVVDCDMDDPKKLSLKGQCLTDPNTMFRFILLMNRVRAAMMPPRAVPNPF